MTTQRCKFKSLSAQQSFCCSLQSQNSINKLFEYPNSMKCSCSVVQELHYYITNNILACQASIKRRNSHAPDVLKTVQWLIISWNASLSIVFNTSSGTCALSLRLFVNTLQAKCHQYWPSSNDEKQYGKIKLKLTGETKLADFTTRYFEIKVRFFIWIFETSDYFFKN